MADFNAALDSLLLDEGGYANNAADEGGETVFGISRHFNPAWTGWVFVDELKKVTNNLVNLNQSLSNDLNIRQATQNFYRSLYWNFDTVSSQTVATKLLSMEVNFGKGSAVRILQEGLVRLGYQVEVDGSLGRQTLATLEKAKEQDVLHCLRAYSALYRLHRVLAKPDQVQFLDGWLWRDTA
jgi:lysozyme family protein